MLSKVDPGIHPSVNTQPRPDGENTGLVSGGLGLVLASLPWLCDLVKDNKPL